MYFSRAQLSRTAFGQDENWELATNGYRAHQLVWSLFSDHEDRTRDFIFRWDTDGALPVLYIVSKRPPVDREANFDILQSKTYAPKLRQGQELAFSLRANPVVKSRDEKGRQLVHDVVMNAKFELRSDPAGEQELTQAELVDREGIKWLQRRTDQYGFVFETHQVLTEAYERHEFRKSRDHRRVVISTIDYQGRLTVTNPDRFTQALFNGVGPSKAFGCGLMLVRPL